MRSISADVRCAFFRKPVQSLNPSCVVTIVVAFLCRRFMRVKQSSLMRIDFDISHFVDDEASVGQEFVERLFFRVISGGSIQLSQEIRKGNKSASHSMVDPLFQE